MKKWVNFLKLSIAFLLLITIVSCGSDDDGVVFTALDVANPSFETSDPITPGFGGGFVITVSDWTLTGLGGTFRPSTPGNPGGPPVFNVFTEDVPDGVNTAFTNGNGKISQVLTSLLTENTIYKLEVEVGERVVLKLPDSLSAELRAGGVVLASGTVTPASGKFATLSFEYATQVGDSFGSPIEVHLLTSHSSRPDVEAQVNWDNVRVSSKPQ